MLRLHVIGEETEVAHSLSDDIEPGAPRSLSRFISPKLHPLLSPDSPKGDQGFVSEASSCCLASFPPSPGAHSIIQVFLKIQNSLCKVWQTKRPLFSVSGRPWGGTGLGRDQVSRSQSGWDSITCWGQHFLVLSAFQGSDPITEGGEGDNTRGLGLALPTSWTQETIPLWPPFLQLLNESQLSHCLCLRPTPQPTFSTSPTTTP